MTPRSGRIVRLGDDINTDVILPGQYLNLTDPAELGAHLLEGYDPRLSASITPGVVLLAGRHFGSGSSREQAPVAMLARGVQAIIAESFARIFQRNAVNLGLAAVESPAAWDALSDGDLVELDLAGGWIRGPDGRIFATPPQPPFLRELMEAGDIVEWTRRRLRARGVPTMRQQ